MKEVSCNKSIKVGEYVRTKDGEIGKVRVIIQNMIFINENQYFYDINKIILHSENIIDLVKKNDYVNGHLVREVYLEGTTKYIKLDNSHSVENDFAGVRTYSEDIKTIVTKEQFEKIKYEVNV